MEIVLCEDQLPSGCRGRTAALVPMTELKSCLVRAPAVAEAFFNKQKYVFLSGHLPGNTLYKPCCCFSRAVVGWRQCGAGPMFRRLAAADKATAGSQTVEAYCTATSTWLLCGGFSAWQDEDVQKAAQASLMTGEKCPHVRVHPVECDLPSPVSEHARSVCGKCGPQQDRDGARQQRHR